MVAEEAEWHVVEYNPIIGTVPLFAIPAFKALPAFKATVSPREKLEPVQHHATTPVAIQRK